MKRSRPSGSGLSDSFRTAVGANAVFCGLSGLAIAGLAGRLPGFLGAGSAGVYLGLGIFLALYGIHLGIASRRSGLGRAEGMLIVAGDVAWVVGSAAVVAAGVLTPVGAAVVLIVAAVVGFFALWQWRALGSVGAGGPETGTGSEGAV